jgi:nucleoid-associated protein EbfC
MNPFDLIKNIQDIQENFKKVQEKAVLLQEIGFAGGDLVKVTVNGLMEVVDIKLDPISVDQRDIPMLQDLIKTATNSSFQKMKERMSQEMGQLAPGLNMQDLLKGGFPNLGKNA